MNHDGNVYPVTAVVKLRLGGGVILVEGDIQEADSGIGGPDAADAGVSNRDGMLDVEGIRGEIVRQGQDLIGIVGAGRRGIGTGRGEVPGGNPELVQVEGAGRLDVEFVSGGFGETAGAYQIAVDEVIELAIGNGNAHGDPLVFVAVVGEISSHILRGGPAVFFFGAMFCSATSPITAKIAGIITL